MRNKFMRKVPGKLEFVFINPAQVFGVVSDGDGGSYIHSGYGFCFNVVESPETVDKMLCDDNEN